MVTSTAHKGVAVESTDVVEAGLEGRIFQDSTGAGIAGGGGACVQTPGEEGSKGGWRTTSTILGGGGTRGFMRARTAFLTSSLRPANSSPAPSSSRPSRAET